MDDDVIRIVISTDNHLGYMEKDPVRCHDSFAAFEEVLLCAKDKVCPVPLADQLPFLTSYLPCVPSARGLCAAGRRYVSRQ